MKYTQTTTTPISDEPQISASDKRGKFYLTALIYVVVGLAIVAAFSYGKSQGRSEAKQEAFKQEKQQTQSKIRAIDEQNKAKATEVRNESQKDREQAKIIRDNAFVPIPEFKPSSQDTMIKYLKEARP